MEPVPVVPAAAVSPLPGFNVMLVGASGAGKTTSVRTLVNAGITPFCIFTEPGFEVLGDIPSDKLHWHYIKPADTSWADMMDSANKINTLSFQTLTGMADMNKKNYRQFYDLLALCNNYVCQRDGKTYGDVSKWNTDRALVLDSLTGVNIMAMNLVVGSKPVKSMADWGVAMDNLERFIQKLCIDTQCHFVLTAHGEPEADEVTGTTRIMAGTLGKKLGPKLPRFFSDVIQSVREGAKFTWNTANPRMDLKTRNLAIGENLAPDFAQIVTKWKSQGGLILPTKA